MKSVREWKQEYVRVVNLEKQEHKKAGVKKGREGIMKAPRYWSQL